MSGPIFFRTATDSSTLEAVRGFVRDTNQDFANFEPTFAVVVTWDGAVTDTSVTVSSIVIRLSYRAQN